MIRRAALLLIPLAVSACAGKHPPLAEASGKYRPLNVGKWTPTRDDLRGPRLPLAPKDSPNANPTPVATIAPAAQPGTEGEGQ